MEPTCEPFEHEYRAVVLTESPAYATRNAASATGSSDACDRWSRRRREIVTRSC